MCKHIVVHDQKHFLYKDFEEMLILRFLLNPRKHSLFFPKLELLIPCGEIPFSTEIKTENRNLQLMGTAFPIITYEAPSYKSKTYNVKVNGTNFHFYVNINSCKQESLLAVRA